MIRQYKLDSDQHKLRHHSNPACNVSNTQNAAVNSDPMVSLTSRILNFVRRCMSMFDAKLIKLHSRNHKTDPLVVCYIVQFTRYKFHTLLVFYLRTYSVRCFSKTPNALWCLSGISWSSPLGNHCKCSTVTSFQESCVRFHPKEYQSIYTLHTFLSNDVNYHIKLS